LREASSLCIEKILAKKSQQRKVAGLINGCRQRQVKWNKENKIIIGTWNVRTPLQPDKMQELAEQISERQLEILAIAASRIAIIGNYMSRRPKYSLIVVVAPKEEESQRYNFLFGLSFGKVYGPSSSGGRIKTLMKLSAMNH
jgi:hypothetical protein